MKPFEVVTATSGGEAVALLAEHGADARILAGGTDLLVELKTAAKVPRVVVDVSRAEDLRQIQLTPDGLSLGALVTHSQIIGSPMVKDLFPALVEAARTIGAVQTRNLGTLGGNLVTAVPSMDSGPTLVALEASVTLSSAKGSRVLPLEELFLGPRRTALVTGEMLTHIVIPAKNLRKPAHFLKFGLRKGQALAIVNAAASLWLDPASRKITAPRIALGAVAPTIIRALNAEQFLEGKTWSDAIADEAGRLAVEAAKPISDFRATAEYRRDLIAVLTRRALAGAVALAHQRTKESKA